MHFGSRGFGHGILVSGVLIGPAALVFWGFLLQMRGGDLDAIWHGDPLAFGMGGAVIFALIVGFLATSVYVIVLKVLHHRYLAAKGSQPVHLPGWIRR